MSKFVVVVCCWVGLVGAAGCTKPNPAVCCLSEADCQAAGIPELRDCERGFVCEANQCIEPTCSAPSDCTDSAYAQCVDGICRGCDPSGNIGCTADQPRCEEASTTCTGCATNDDCAPFGAQSTCGNDGRCVECSASEQCSAASPVCEAGACRACELDSECASNVCSSDGSCVAVEDTIFVTVDGVDSGNCTQTQPCATARYGATKATGTRTHVLLAPGNYAGNDFVVSGTSIHLHGYGAKVNPMLVSAAEPQSWVRVQDGTLRISGLTIEQTAATNGIALRCFPGTSIELDEVRIVVPFIAVGADTCAVKIARSSLRSGASNRPVLDVFAGSLEMTRSHIDTSSTNVASSVLITNSLFTDTNLKLVGSRGRVAFSTFYNPLFSGAAIDCANRDPDRTKLENSIIWTPNATTAQGGLCRPEGNLIGPVSPPCEAECGNFNAAPQFISSQTGDLHLSPTSPARDRAVSGPDVDYEGDPRPVGSGWDIGFDEVQ